LNNNNSLVNKKVLCLLLFFLILRLAGLNFGLPFDGVHPRENFTISHSINYLSSGNLKPHDFQHPTFLQYLVTLFSFVLFLPKFIFAKGTPAIEVISYYEVFYIIARAISALASSLAVIAIYFAAKRLKVKTTAIFAMLLMGFNFLAVKFAHYATPDSLALLFVSLCLLYALKVLEECKLKNIILCGLFCGFSFGAKLSGFISLGYFFIAYLISLKNKHFNFKFILFPPLCAFLGFFITSPYHIINFNEFIRGSTKFLIERGFIDTQIVSLKYTGFYEYPFVFIPVCLGLFTYLFFFAGSNLLAKKEFKKFILIILPLVIYFLTLGKESAATSRNVLPALPSLVLSAAYFFSWLAQKKLYKTAAILIILSVFSQVAKSTVFDYFLLKKDTRVLAKEWIETNIEEGKKLAFEPYTPYDLNQIETSGLAKKYRAAYFIPSLAVYPASFYKEKGFDYIVVADVRQKDYELICQRKKSCEYSNNYSAFEEDFELVAEFSPLAIFKITAFPKPWGTWPHNPQVKIYKVK